jgi:hypothetical protein
MHIEPEPSTTTRIARVVRLRRGAIVAIAALACAGLASACGSSTSTSSTSTPANLNVVRVQRSIEESILKQRHLHATVTCPSVVPQEQGKVFECIAVTHSTAKPSVEGRTPFVVTIQNKSGYVTYVGK